MKTTRGYLERLVALMGDEWRIEAKDPNDREGTTFLVRDRDQLRLACNTHVNGFVARAMVPAGVNKKQHALTAQTMPRSTFGIKQVTLQVVAARLHQTVIQPATEIYARVSGQPMPKIIAFSDSPHHDRQLAKALAPMLAANDLTERTLQVVDADRIQIQITDAYGSTRMVILASTDALAKAISARAQAVSQNPDTEIAAPLRQIPMIVKDCA